jgi:HK97 family phage portal protein
MALFSKTRRFISGGKAALSKKSSPYSSDAFGDFSGAGVNLNNDSKRLDTYEKLSWVSTCTDRLSADAGAREWWFVDKRTGDRIENTARINQSIIVPLEMGYFNNTFGKMMGTVVGHRAIVGNAFFLKRATTAFGAARGIADTLIPIQPKNVKPIVSNNGIVLEGYEITFSNGHRQKFPRNEVIHFSQNTMFSPFWGVGNIQKARLVAEGEIAGDSFANEFLENRAVPSMAITESTDRTPEDNERITQTLSDKFQKKANAGKILHMNGENIRIDQLQFSQKDIQFIEAKQFNRQAIISVFGCNPVVVGIPEGANKAVAQTMRNNFLANTVNPIIKDLETTLNSQFVNLIDDTIELKFSRHTTGDVENVAAMITTGIITPNRGSELMGETTDPEDVSRSTYYAGINLAPLSSEVSPDASEDGKSIDDTEVLEAKACSCHEPAAKRLDDPRNIDEICHHFEKSATRPKRFQVRYLRAALKSRMAIETKYTFELAKFFERQGKRVVDSFMAKTGIKADVFLEADDIPQVVSVVYNLNFETAELQKEMKKLHTSGVQRGIKDINAVTGFSVIDSIANPFVAESIGKLGARVTGAVNAEGVKISIVETSRKEIERIILHGVDNQLTAQEMAKNLGDKFKSYQGYRARMIARTESAASWDAGAVVAYKDLGVEVLDMVGCTEFEPEYDCGKQGIPIGEASSVRVHPNHVGSLAPAKEI